MKITSQTKLCILIGNPVEHSVSPEIHNAGYRALGLNFVYLACRVSDLRSAVAGLRGLGIRGASVTIPHKEAIIPYLDELSELARWIRAVNTVVNENGKLIGYNFDGEAAYLSLRANGVKLEGKKIVMIGAGGASRAIVFTIASKRKSGEIVLLDIREQVAEALAQEVSQKTHAQVRAVKMDQKNLEQELEDASVLINASPVGMYPKIKESPVPVNLLRKELVVFDIVYNPFWTKLLKEARKKGAKVIGGLEMLVRQAGEQFRLFTGKNPPLKIMFTAGKKALKS